MYTEQEGQDCFDGTLEQCNEFVSEQNTIGLVVVPMTKEEIDSHPDNQK